jgi:two-component system, NtrC family, response regulator PilR
MARILIVDDEPSLREVLGIALSGEGHDVTEADSLGAARGLLKSVERFHLVITDLKLPDGSGLEVLREVKARSTETQVIVVTAFATAETGVEAMKLGAYDYIFKPFSMNELMAQIEKALEKADLVRENRALRQELAGRYRVGNLLLGQSEPMLQVAGLVEKVAAGKATVLIQGASGTGKEVCARAIHFNSARANKPFVAVNCGAIPEALMESELFGHVKGAFTGADRDRLGTIPAANGGTLFLDEIGELPLPLQVKLLRVLQERTVKPVGGSRELPVDIRVIAATNRDLAELVKAGHFREDLFYRLNVIPIQLPSLDERREDIPMLAEHFAQKFARELGLPPFTFTEQAMTRIQAGHYPGNVRQLENIMERAVTLATGTVITEELLDLFPAQAFVETRRASSGGGSTPGDLAEPGELGYSGLESFLAPLRTEPGQLADLPRAVETLERTLLKRALAQAGGHKTNAARLLGLKFRAFRYLLQKYGLGDETTDSPANDETNPRFEVPENFWGDRST